MGGKLKNLPYNILITMLITYLLVHSAYYVDFDIGVTRISMTRGPSD